MIVTPYTIELYRLDVVNAQFVLLDELIDVKNLTFTKKRKKFGMATFSLNIDDPKARFDSFTRYSTQVLIKKGGVPLWLGFIEKITGHYNNVFGSLNVQCLEYFAHLTQRYSEQLVNYVSTAITTIYPNLITDVQARTNGTLLINSGTLQTIANINETLEYAEIAQKIMQQADNINGFEFDIKPVVDSNGKLTSTTFNIYKGLGRQRSDLPALELGINVQTISFATQDTIINSVIGLGSGSGTGVLISELESEGSQIGYTRREDIRKYSDVSVPSTLESKVETYVNAFSGENFDINVTLEPGTFDILGLSLGDTLQMKLYRPNTYINFNGYRTVSEITVSIDNEGVEFITPKLTV